MFMRADMGPDSEKAGVDVVFERLRDFVG